MGDSASDAPGLPRPDCTAPEGRAEITCEQAVAKAWQEVHPGIPQAITATRGTFDRYPGYDRNELEDAWTIEYHCVPVLIGTRNQGLANWRVVLRAKGGQYLDGGQDLENPCTDAEATSSPMLAPDGTASTRLAVVATGTDWALFAWENDAGEPCAQLLSTTGDGGYTCGGAEPDAAWGAVADGGGHSIFGMAGPRITEVQAVDMPTNVTLMRPPEWGAKVVGCPCEGFGGRATFFVLYIGDGLAGLPDEVNLVAMDDGGHERDRLLVKVPSAH